MTQPALGPQRRGLALVTSLADHNETPFFVYDTAVFQDRIALLRSVLPARSGLLYSAKANPHPELLARAGAAGCGLELASTGELAAMRAADGDPARAVIVGPAKSAGLLTAAVEMGAGHIVVESPGELRRLAALVRGLGRRNVPVLLRLSLSGARGTLRMSGHQFGMERRDLLTCLGELATCDALRFVGYHGYLASQLLSAADVLHNSELVVAAVAALAADAPAPAVLDLGGGFGIPYTAGEAPLDLAELAAGMARLALGPAEVLFESGRFLAGPAGALVCRVIDSKIIGGRRFVLADGGINVSGLFGAANAMRHMGFTVLRDGEPVAGGEPANICGPLCTPLDRLATGVPCAAEAGDLLVWWNMGAYGLTAAPVGFLSFPAPRELLA